MILNVTSTSEVKRSASVNLANTLFAIIVTEAASTVAAASVPTPVST
ncbi:MAG: hypothetical protein QF535_05545 [Anaerolineales bacterium]|nr:hypothetical protein [Anaerolineales bacterium]